VQDFNRDGKADVAIVLSEIGAVSIIPGRGDGTFPAPQAYGGYQGAWAIVAGDFNGDGKPDLVTTNLLDNSISVFTGVGDGTFAVGATAPTGLVPSAAAVGDFNRDARLDLAVVNQTCTSLPCANGTVSVYLGNGDGTFQPPMDYATGNIPVAVTVADLNGDGIPDLAVVNNGFGFSNSVSLFLGRGDGTFVSGGALATGNGPTQAVAADFDGNGALDLAVANGAGISVILGRGAGTFGPPNNYPIANGALAIATGDFNQDGKPDLAVTTLDSVVVLLGNGDGTFQAGVSYPLESVIAPTAILVGDFNGDGKPDLLVGKSSNAVSILIGKGDGTFQPPVDIPVGKSERGWVAGHFGGDGGLDLAAASVSPNAVFVALNSPVMGLYPARVNFGGQAVGAGSAPATVTVSNPSGAPLAISGVTVSGAFTVDNNCPATLAPGTSCALGISFLPKSAGEAAGMLTITDNAIGSPQSIPLQGAGIIAPAASITPGSLTFGPQKVGTRSGGALVTVLNSGGGPLSIAGIRASGDFTAAGTCPSPLAVGARCTITVTFTPRAAGIRTGILTVNDNTPMSPQTVAITGQGAAPRALVAPLSLTFENRRVGVSSSGRVVSLHNSGNAPLAVSSIKLKGPHTADFSLQNHCGESLAAGKSCGVVVFFTPHAAGKHTATLEIITDSAGSPQAVALTGAGVALRASTAPSPRIN
jgi:hypothetical protein